MKAKWPRWRASPQSLSTRIALIIIGGLLLAQILTGTIWSESRRRALLEIPTRVFAARVADAMRVVLDRPPTERAAALRVLDRPGFHLSLLNRLPVQPPIDADIDRTQALIASVIQRHYEHPVEVRVLRARLLGDDRRPLAGAGLLNVRNPVAAFQVAVRAAPGAPWFVATGAEDENGAETSNAAVVADYVIRIYVLRLFAVALLTFLAVRLALAPLARMTNAAEALGRDVRHPPIEVKGPREVRRAAETFNAMQARIIANLDERDRFFAAVSHDLRSPLTRLRLHTELMSDDRARQTFRDELTDMEAMVEAALAFVTNEADRSFAVDVDVDALLQRMIRNLTYQGMPVSLRGAMAGTIVGYPQSLHRCLQNLIDNAIKYGHRADIEVTSSDVAIGIAVRDEGPGIPADRLTAMLEPFARMDAFRGGGHDGFGLGLSIADMIVKAHGGRLHLTNLVPRGFEVRVVLPRSPLCLPDEDAG
ncbi:ATP-binding protein [Sphingomonadaceae bacterium jetA1]|jgi:signal transduction histidine kinase|uniref:ATP-binding protein n=1 Tax=Facivitalis istanbulensis TaxID=3075838 RepID=UPI0034953EA4